MDLFETLKQLKTIQPEASFTERSKREILATMPREVWSFRRTVVTIIETGFAVGLATFFIFALSGQLPGPNSAAQFSVINPDSLRAEAQAVDIQIQLANLNYAETTSTAESTPRVAAAIIQKQPKLLVTPTAPEAATGTAAGTSIATGTETTSTISIDQALKALSE